MMINMIYDYMEQCRIRRMASLAPEASQVADGLRVIRPGARSRLRRPPLPTSEFVLLPARIRSLVSRTAGIIQRIFRILKTDQKAVATACPMRAMTPDLYEVVIQNNLVEEVGSKLAASERGRNRCPCRDPRPAREQRRDENQGTR